MLLNPFTVHTPTSSLEAARLYGSLEDVRILAGGTFLLNSMKLLKTKGTRTARHVLSLSKIDALKEIAVKNDALSLGAMVRINDLLENPLVAKHAPVLPIVSRNIATNPIRNMATLGGNLTCRYTWTEMGAVMIALDARMHFLKEDGQLSVILAEDFFKDAARSKGLLTHLTIQIQEDARVMYRRVKKTAHMDQPSLALCVKTQIKDKQWCHTRVAINNGTAFAQRDTVLEDFLNKNVSTPSLGTAALAHLTAAMYDTRSSVYKKHIFRVTLKSAIDALIQG